MNYKQATLNALKHIRDHGPNLKLDGICYNVQDLTSSGICRAIAMSYAALWPKAIGYFFPIEGNTERYEAPGKWEGLRGERRKELLDWMIQQIEADQKAFIEQGPSQSPS